MPTAADRSQAALPLQPYKSLDNEELTARIQAVRAEMGPRLLILGHHYQQDEVIALSDLRGDSYRLSELAAADKECRAIVFCGVHFMAETADVLANRPERLAERNGQRVPVVLPDLAAGCSMADMAEIEQVEDCWQQLGEVIDVGRRDAGHLRQLRGQPEGVLRPARRDRLHVGQRRGRAPVGLRPAAAACSSSPISTWAATPPCAWASRLEQMPSGTRARTNSAATRPDAIRRAG